MNDADDKPQEGSNSEEPQGPLGGERLAEARRAQQISVHEIAKELHLDEPKVRALERNEFDMLGAPVFAKGHLKKYAQLVQVDEDDMLSDYYQLNRSQTIPPVISGRPRPRREMSPGPWIAVIVVIIVVATAYWWFTSRPTSVDEPEQPGLIPQETMPAAEEEAIEAIVDDSSVLESASEELPSSVEESSPPVEESSPPPALGDGQLRVLLTYSGDCWTEISDATGRRLFFDLGTDGRTVELSGAAPFNVLFGNADNVSIQVNGSDHAISAAERRGRTARLTLTDP